MAMAINESYPIRAFAEMPDGSMVPVHLGFARSFLERFCGLMLKRAVPAASGLIFLQCRSIHMMFMRIPLDVLWVEPAGGGYRVVSLVQGVRPWTVANGRRPASAAIEFAAGTFDEAPAFVRVVSPPSEVSPSTR